MSPTDITRTVLTRLVEAYATGDRSAAYAATHPDIVWECIGPSEFFPTCGQRLGRAAVFENFEKIAEMFSITEFRAARIVADGEYGALRLLGWFTSRRNGRRHRIELFCHARVIDDQVVEWREMFDSVAAARDLHDIDMSMLALSTEPLERL
jgi:ketosteroid isomerase-like protein